MEQLEVPSKVCLASSLSPSSPPQDNTLLTLIILVLLHPLGRLSERLHHLLECASLKEIIVSRCQPPARYTYLTSGTRRNFGIFKHPRSQNSSTSLQPPSTARSDETSVSTKDRRPTVPRARSNEGDCIERLHAAGLLDVYWHGKCEAEKVTTGTYAVKEGGMFALVRILGFGISTMLWLTVDRCLTTRSRSRLRNKQLSFS